MSQLLRPAASQRPFRTQGQPRSASRARRAAALSRPDHGAAAPAHQQLLQQAAAVLAAALLTSQPAPALAAEDAAAAATVASTSGAPQAVYFGNGCFWGRQKNFVDTEKALGRTDPAAITALVGYAGGRATGPDGKVCYYYNGDPRTIYERLGHAEVVQVALSDDTAAAQEEFKKFAKTYFADFQPAPRGRGMMRLDPQDAGPGYRNVVGLPGGVRSPYFKLLEEANARGMELREGRGNVYERGAPAEGDELNVVWVVDSGELPFYRAEQYHQFHDGLGKAFSREYTRDLKAAVAAQGRIGPTGCLEVPF